jgi:hypothetical protein
MDRLGDSNNASPIPDGLLTKETPLLESLPRETEWISVANIHFMQPDLVQPNTVANLGVRLSCLGFGGTVLSQYQSCIAKASVVNVWISKRKRTSFVLSLFDDVIAPPPRAAFGLECWAGERVFRGVSKYINYIKDLYNVALSLLEDGILSVVMIHCYLRGRVLCYLRGGVLAPRKISFVDRPRRYRDAWHVPFRT